MELLDIVSEDTGLPIGTCASRFDVITQELWCRSTNVFVLNEHGEILVHQRSAQKERFPGVWCTHLGGHVGTGETFETNAIKELHEESGIRVQEEQLIGWRTSKLAHAHLWVRDFMTVVEKDKVELIPQPGEVDQFAWLTMQDILRSKNENPHLWLTGTHDFEVEYPCLRAVAAAGQTMGLFNIPRDFTHWHTPVIA